MNLIASLFAAIPAPVPAGRLVAHEPERELDPMCIAIEEEMLKCILSALRASSVDWQQYVMASLAGPYPPWWTRLWRRVRYRPLDLSDTDDEYDYAQ